MKFYLAVGKQHEGWRRHGSLGHVINLYLLTSGYRSAVEIHLLDEAVYLPVPMRLRRSLATCSSAGKIFSVPTPVAADTNNTGA